MTHSIVQRPCESFLDPEGACAQPSSSSSALGFRSVARIDNDASMNRLYQRLKDVFDKHLGDGAARAMLEVQSIVNTLNAQQAYHCLIALETLLGVIKNPFRYAPRIMPVWLALFRDTPYEVREEVFSWIQKHPRVLTYLFEDEDEDQEMLCSLFNFQQYCIRGFSRHHAQCGNPCERREYLSLTSKLIKTTPSSLWIGFPFDKFNVNEVVSALHEPVLSMIKIHAPQNVTSEHLMEIASEAILCGDSEVLDLLILVFPELIVQLRHSLSNLAKTLAFPSTFSWLYKHSVISAAPPITPTESNSLPIRRTRSTRVYGGTSCHKTYLYRQHDAIIYTLRRLQGICSVTLEELMVILGNWRHSVAAKTNNNTARMFGQFRTCELQTRVDNTPENNAVFLRMRLLAGQQIQASITDADGIVQEVILTETILYTPTQALWRHTRREELQKLMPYLQMLFDLLLQMQVGSLNVGERTAIIRRIGEFHWWWAHACPYDRGSAAIGEVIVIALLAYHGITGVQLASDAERFALATPSPQEFAEIYHTFL